MSTCLDNRAILMANLNTALKFLWSKISNRGCKNSLSVYYAGVNFVAANSTPFHAIFADLVVSFRIGR